jgi:hypothetical protein
MMFHGDFVGSRLASRPQNEEFQYPRRRKPAVTCTHKIDDSFVEPNGSRIELGPETQGHVLRCEQKGKWS